MKTAIERNRILAIASDIFEERGYAQTTTREIAEKAGIGRGNLYYYFKKKEDMLFAHLRITCIKITNFIEENLKEKGDWKLKIALELLLYDVICERDTYVRELTAYLHKTTDEFMNKLVEHCYRMKLPLLKEDEVKETDLFQSIRVGYLMYFDSLFSMQRYEHRIENKVSRAISHCFFNLNFTNGEIEEVVRESHVHLGEMDLDSFMETIFDKNYDNYQLK